MAKYYLFTLLFFLNACASQDIQEAVNENMQNSVYMEVTLAAGKPKNMNSASLGLMLEKFHPFYKDISLQISKYIRHLYQDRSGAIWIGTNDDGIARMVGERLDYFTPELGLGGRAVRGIAEDAQQRIWVATNGGISIIDHGKIENLTTANGLPSNEVWSLFIDSKDRVWAGTLNGLTCFDKTNLKDGKPVFKKLALPLINQNSVSRFSNKLVWNIYEDADGNLWFGTDGDGVKKYDGKTILSFGKKEGLSHDNVLSIVQDNNKNMWFCTWGGGLSKYDGKEFKTYDEKNGLVNNNVWSSLKDKDGNLWFGTLGSGIQKYDGKSFSIYREKQGLTRNHVQSILQDKDGHIWFGFSGGVFKLDGNFLRNIRKPGC